MSGAEPCTGSKMPGPPSPRLAEAASPRPPAHPRRDVGEDVAERVLGQDHVELLRALDELHPRGVDEHVLELDVRVVGRDARHRLAPEPGRLEHVRLVDRRDVRAGARRRARTRAGRSARSPPACTRRCRRRSRRAAGRWRRSRARRRARGRSGGRCRDRWPGAGSRRRRARARSAIRPCSGRTGAPSSSGRPTAPRMTASARLARGERPLGQRRPLLQDRAAAEAVLLDLDLERERAEDVDRDRRHLRADSVSGQAGDAQHQRPSSCFVSESRSVEAASPSRERPLVRLVQMLQEQRSRSGSTEPTRSYPFAPDLRDELEPAVEQAHGGAIVLRDQLAKSFEPVRGARGGGAAAIAAAPSSVLRLGGDASCTVLTSATGCGVESKVKTRVTRRSRAARAPRRRPPRSRSARRGRRSGPASSSPSPVTRRTTRSSAVTVPSRSASRSAPRQIPAAASPKTPERLGEQGHVRADLVLGHRVDRAAGGARRGHRVVAVGGVPDRERAGDRLRTDRRHRPLLAEGGGDGLAALRLGADQPRRRSLDQSELDELAEAPSDLREQRAGRDRADDGVGEPSSRAARRSRTRASSSPRRSTSAGRRSRTPTAARTRARRSAGCSRRSSRAPRRSSRRRPRSASSFSRSSPAGQNTAASSPSTAARAATAAARFPVDEHASVSSPSSCAFAHATATTRSLNECVGFAMSSLR